MKLTAKEISALVEGKLYGNPEIVVTGAAGLEEAGESDISFLGNLKYNHLVKETKAGVIFLNEKMEGLKQTIIVVKNPQLAFAKVLTLIDSEKKSVIEKGIHSTAIIGQNVKLGHEITIGPYVVIEDDVCVGNSTKILAQVFIGAGSKIGHGCFIHPGVKIKENIVIGHDCIIYPNVTIRDNVVIGNNCIIHPGAVLGADGFGFVPTEKGNFKIPQIGEVEIGDDVEIGSNVTIDRATTGKTKIGKGTKIDNLVMIAHNVHIGEHCLIVAQTGISGSTKVGNFVTFAGQSGTVGHIKIGNGAIIGAQSGVMNDVGEKEFVFGYPAKLHKDAMKNLAILNKLPEMYEHYKKQILKEKKKD